MSNVVPFTPAPVQYHQQQQYHQPQQQPIEQNQARLTEQAKDDEIFKRTLYVGNLHKNASENVLKALFAVIGNVVDIKMINDAALSTSHYCFITYETHLGAQRALAAMNGRDVYKMPLKVNWATRPDGIKKDTSKDHHIFVGDLAQELTTLDLQKEFEKFGKISEARVVRDAQTNRSKGYGFVAFLKKESAEMAISEMNNKSICGREVRTNWATSRKLPPPTVIDPHKVAQASSFSNTTVYVGGITKDVHTQQVLQASFSRFGTVEEVRTFETFGFVKMQTHQAATTAICEMNGASISGCTVKCRWGKDDHKSSNDGNHGQYGHTNYKEANQNGSQNSSNTTPQRFVPAAQMPRFRAQNPPATYASYMPNGHPATVGHHAVQYHQHYSGAYSAGPPPRGYSIPPHNMPMHAIHHQQQLAYHPHPHQGIPHTAASPVNMGYYQPIYAHAHPQAQVIQNSNGHRDGKRNGGAPSE